MTQSLHRFFWLRRSGPRGLLLSLILLAGCQSPFLVFPGGALMGTESATDSWSVLEGHHLMQLETRPSSPYSVILRITRIDGGLYVDASKSRRWAGYLEDDPRVRIKVGKSVFRAIAVPVTDPEITDHFFAGRAIYEIKPGGW